MKNLLIILGLYFSVVTCSLWGQDLSFKYLLLPKATYEPSLDTQLTQEISTARVGITYQLNQAQPVGFKLSVNIPRDNMLSDAYIFKKFSPASETRVGRYRLPFGLDFQRRRSDIAVQNRSEISSEIKDLFGSIRGNGLGHHQEYDFGTEWDIHILNSQFILLNIMQEFQSLKFGFSHISEGSAHVTSLGDFSHYYTGYLEWKPSNWRIEWESHYFDSYQINDFNHRGLVGYGFELGPDVSLMPIQQFEFQSTTSGNSLFLRHGLAIFQSYPQAHMSTGVSLNQYESYTAGQWDWVDTSVKFLIKGRFDTKI